jgi:uncharacterized protein
MTEVTVEHRKNAKRFTARTPTGIAFMSYAKPDAGTYDLQHTVVPEADRGHGIGGQLVRAALAHARQEGARVIPTCPFVKWWLERHPSESDLVK